MIFLGTDGFVNVFAAKIIGFDHAAIGALLFCLRKKADTPEFAHAVMSMNGCTAAGNAVDKEQKDSGELFHFGTKLAK